jgi:hypothetical protein
MQAARRHEGGEIEPGAAEQQLVMDELVGDLRWHRVIGQPLSWRRDPGAERWIGLADERIRVGVPAPVLGRSVVQRQGRHYSAAVRRPQQTRSRR